MGKKWEGAVEPAGKDLWNIERVVGEAEKGIAVEMDLERHNLHLELGNIRMLLILITN